MTTFADIIPMEDQYLVAQARMEIAVTTVWLNRMLTGLLSRVLGEEEK